MNLKYVLPLEVNYALKHFIERFHPEKNVCDKTALSSYKRVFFLDTPAYENIGDQTIAFAMKSFVSDVLPDFQQIEITEDRLPSSLKWLRETIRKEDIICLTGGGNMGVLYQRYEAVRRLVIKSFSDNPIIVFPQTMDYGNTRYGAKELKRAKKIYGRAKNLTLCSREEASYSRMKKNFPNAKVLSCKDIVLYLDYSDCFVRSDEIGLCLRDDKESVLSETQRAEIEKRFSNAKMLTTMADKDIYISPCDRKAVVEKAIEEFGSKRMIITDRLHGMIFAYITNTPCIALPNSNGKVEDVSQYLSKAGNVVFSKTADEEIPNVEKHNRSFHEDFKELKDTLRKITDSRTR